MKDSTNLSYRFSKTVIYVLLLLLTISIVVPVGWVFLASIKENKEFYGNPWTLPQSFYFENFVKAWEKAKMADYMLNSVIVTGVALFLLVVIALPASYVLARFRFKSRTLINTLFMGGLFINVNYIVVPIFLMLNDGDQMLKRIHFIKKSFFLNNLFILAIVYAATALPFTIYLLSGYFRTLAKDYEEAAYVDGAGYFYTMTRIMIPMAKPSVITVILFNFLGFWNEYIIAMTLLTKPALKTLPVGLVNLMAAQRSAVEYGQLYAGLVIVMLPTLFLYILVQQKLTQGMTAGGIKG